MQKLSKYTRDKAISLLVNQLKHEYNEKGLEWNDAISVTIEESVDYIIQAAVQAVKESIEIEIKWKND